MELKKQEYPHLDLFHMLNFLKKQGIHNKLISWMFKQAIKVHG